MRMWRFCVLVLRESFAATTAGVRTRPVFWGKSRRPFVRDCQHTPKRVPTLAALALSPWRPHELFVKALKCAPVRAATGRAIATAPREAPSASIVEFFCVCLLLLFGSPFS